MDGDLGVSIARECVHGACARILCRDDRAVQPLFLASLLSFEAI
jgi:hypothetical protein